MFYTIETDNKNLKQMAIFFGWNFSNPIVKSRSMQEIKNCIIGYWDMAQETTEILTTDIGLN